MMRLLLRHAVLLAGVGCMAAPTRPTHAPPARGDGGTEIGIAYEHYRLPNGLHVILAPNNATPTVTVDVWYHVGSKNDRAGRTGFAHLFEHIMFRGSGHVPHGVHLRLTEGIGGRPNGFTTPDRTTYFETVPSNYLETALWLESDRMGFLLQALDSAKFVAERDIVRNERRQGIENQPYGRASEIIMAAFYPEGHPYSWPLLGYMSDLQQASLDDARQFFRTYYAPNNATLAIVGDFDVAQAKAWVEKYFGDLPRGRAVTRPTVRQPGLVSEKRLVYEDRVQVPRLYFRWPAVSAKSDDNYALDVLSEILTGARTARLTNKLVYDLQSATTVSSTQTGRENAGEFAITITPRPGNTLTDVEAQMDSVIQRLQREGPTADEMTKAKAGLEFEFMQSLESDLGKAEILNAGAVFFGDPGYFRAQYQRLRSVTAADVQRVAGRYLTRNRIVLSIVPHGQANLAAKPESSTRVTVSADGGGYIMEGN